MTATGSVVATRNEDAAIRGKGGSSKWKKGQEAAMNRFDRFLKDDKELLHETGRRFRGYSRSPLMTCCASDPTLCVSSWDDLSEAALCTTQIYELFAGFLTKVRCAKP